MKVKFDKNSFADMGEMCSYLQLRAIFENTTVARMKMEGHTITVSYKDPEGPLFPAVILKDEINCNDLSKAHAWIASFKGSDDLQCEIETPQPQEIFTVREEMRLAA